MSDRNETPGESGTPPEANAPTQQPAQPPTPPSVPQHPHGQVPQGQVPQYPQAQVPQYPQGQALQYPRAPVQGYQTQDHQTQGQYPPPTQRPLAQPSGLPYGAAVAAPSRRRVWPWLVGAGALAIVVLAGALAIPLLLAAPSGPVAATPDVTILPVEPSSTASPNAPTDAPTAPESTPTEDDLAAVFAERDAFLAAQQQPMDGSELSPRTPEQKQFIADQTAWVEQNGGAVMSQAVSIWLALAIDGCETAILNAHDVDSSIFAMHVSTSPLISALVAQSDNPSAEPNLAQTMVFGMSYICPSDGEQWSALWDEAYGG